MELLTLLQQQILKALGRSSLRDDFYMTGGTALSAFYLQHRFSEDLDFFTSDPTAVARVASVLQQISDEFDAQITFTRTLGSFLECFIDTTSGEQVKMDFAQDSPYRLHPTVFNNEYGIHVDNVVDIACNKLSALFDRSEPKDFVDVYFVCLEVMPFEQLAELTRQKHVGIDDYWLAVALQRINHVSLLPRMVKPVTLVEMKVFFLDLAKGLMGRVDAGKRE